MSIKHLASLNVTGSVTASNGVITVTTDGTPTIELPDGAIAVDTTNDKIYFRSGGEWQEVIGGGGGGIAIQPEAPIDTELLWLDTDEPGVSGPTGPTGSTGPAGVTTGPTAPVDTSVIWADTSTTGVAIIPVGGTTGQMLSKTSGTDYDTAWVTPVTSSDLALKANLADPTFTGTVSGISKTMVGLGSVDNTADTAKPVSTAQQTALDLKANLASPALTGTPSAPTAAAATNTTQIATTEFVRTEVANLVNGATATLDTLGEIATALGNDANLSSTLTTSIGLKAPIASPTFTGTVGGITKTMVGLGNVDNTSNATERAASATLTNKTLTSPVINSPTGITKTDVGLGSVDNTADTAKPVSLAQQTALNLKANLAGPTFTGTVSASTINSSNYQQGGNAGSIVRSGYSSAVSFGTGGTNALITMPSGCTIYNMISCHPVTGVNNTVQVTAIRYGDWSGVQTTNQVMMTGYLGNGVHTEPFNVIFYWVA